MKKNKVISLSAIIIGICIAPFAFASQSAMNYYLNFSEKNKSHDVYHEQERFIDPGLLAWISSNKSPYTGLSQSFEIPEENREQVYGRMGRADSVEGIIERVIVEEGLVIYDGAVKQIVLTLLGSDEDLPMILKPIEVYWKGSLGELDSIRTGYPINRFIYDPTDPARVSSNLNHKGQRGFIFRIINAHGRYTTQDPLDGKTHFEGFPSWPRIHWEDWKPVAGENAWVAMACMHAYHKKYYDRASGQYQHNLDSIALNLAEELARAAMILQAENGGVRMAPMGTYMPGRIDGKGWYNVISTENNLSWYGAFRMLYQVTGKSEYLQAMEKMEDYFRLAWNEEKGFFYQGMSYFKNQWHPEKRHFATDVQTWGILVLGCEKIDEMFGYGSAYSMWQAAKEHSGVFSLSGDIQGVGFTKENDRLSVEWTAGAIAAARELSDYYAQSSSIISRKADQDARQMRQGIEFLRKDFKDGRKAYSYSSRRGWIPFGWYSHDPEVLSMASTTWVALIDAGINPFFLPEIGDAHAGSLSKNP